MSVVLVTGAGGRLGRRLVPALLEAGHTVIASARSPDALRHTRVQRVALDLTDRQAFQTLPKEIEVIVHAAAARPAIPPRSANLAEVLRTNIFGTLNLLEYAAVSHAKKVIYCSSMSVYALPQPLPISEDGLTYPVGLPDSYYGISKLGGELLCEQFRREGRAACLSIRFGRLYGPGEMEGSLLALWGRQASQGQDLIVHGDGERSLDFLYVDDAVQGLVAAVHSDWSGGIVNLSSGIETMWRTLAERIIEIFTPPGVTSRIRYMADGHRTRCVLDVSKVGRVLGFKPRYGLREGLTAWREGEWEGHLHSEAVSVQTHASPTEV